MSILFDASHAIFTMNDEMKQKYSDTNNVLKEQF